MVVRLAGVRIPLISASMTAFSIMVLGILRAVQPFCLWAPVQA